MKCSKFSIYFSFCLIALAVSRIVVCGQITDWKKTYAPDLETVRATIATDHPGWLTSKIRLSPRR